MSLQFAFPELYELVVTADDDRRRAATRVACEIARRRTGLAGAVVERAAAALETERYGETDERRAIKDLAEQLEREAPDVDTPTWHRAQAARAYAFALLAQSKRAADDGIFLAIVAVGEELAEIEPAVRAMLTPIEPSSGSFQPE